MVSKHNLFERCLYDYGTPNTSQVTSIVVDNSKFFLTIRITKVTITIIADREKNIKVLFPIYMVTINSRLHFELYTSLSIFRLQNNQV